MLTMPIGDARFFARSGPLHAAVAGGRTAAARAAIFS